MKVIRIAVLVMAMAGLIAGAAIAADVAKGKALFENPKAFGGQQACSSCHPKGKGLEKAGGKKSFKIMGKVQNSLEEAVNFCIVNASKGKVIDAKSAEMSDITAYIKSLKKDTGGY